MTPAVTELLRALSERKVRYVVVGGVAAIAHGVLRFTRDLDLVIRLDRDNLLSAGEAFRSCGYVPRQPVTFSEFADPANRERWRREKNMLVLQLAPPAPTAMAVDVFTEHPFDFDLEHEAALLHRLGDVVVPIVRAATLVEMKRAAGRPRDLEDIRALEGIRTRADE